MSSHDPRPTLVILGCGNRGGNAYARWCADHPDRVRVTAIAEHDPRYRDQVRDLLGLDESQCYTSAEDLLAQPRLADGLVLSLTENMRLEPMRAALERGYAVLCEKPLARSRDELAEIDALVRAQDRPVLTCHVLRHQPFFREVQRIVASGALGRVVHIQHNENMGYWHFTHSYVRGVFRNSAKAGPIILAKTSHDLDILSWLADSPAERVSSQGELTHFRPERAPVGAALRCMDGCALFNSCPHNAVQLYVEELGEASGWPVSMVEPRQDREARRRAIAEGPYGRCVYHCDNTQPDHQTTSVRFENGITAVLTASAFTGEDTRTVRIFGTDAELLGHMESGRIEVRRFAGADGDGVRPFGLGASEVIHVDTGDGHEMGDTGLVDSFVRVLAGEEDDPVTAWSRSTDSHWMAFAAEESRAHSSAWVNVDHVRGRRHE
ncbi:Gfo/Idh/MocA family protein [Propionibacteriaceae bacterium G1746]